MSKSRRIEELLFQQMRLEFGENANLGKSMTDTTVIDAELVNSIQENHERIQNQLKDECKRRALVEKTLAGSQKIIEELMMELMMELNELKSFAKVNVEVKDQSSQTGETNVV